MYMCMRVIRIRAKVTYNNILIAVAIANTQTYSHVHQLRTLWLISKHSHILIRYTKSWIFVWIKLASNLLVVTSIMTTFAKRTWAMDKDIDMVYFLSLPLTSLLLCPSRISMIFFFFFLSIILWFSNKFTSCI